MIGCAERLWLKPRFEAHRGLLLGGSGATLLLLTISGWFVGNGRARLGAAEGIAGLSEKTVIFSTQANL